MRVTGRDTKHENDREQIMKIIVVKTCDGDVYFRGDRNASKSKAMDMATNQVLNYDLSGYCQEDVSQVKIAKDGQNWTNLWKALMNCGAIRENTLQE